MLESLLLWSPSDLGAPTPIVIGILVLVVGLLIIRFILKSAFTLLKIAFLVAIGIAVWIGLSWLMDKLA